MTTQQGAPLINLGVDITPEVIEKNKWYAFWDAPFVIPAFRSPHRREREGPLADAVSLDRHRRASRRRGEAQCRPARKGASTDCRGSPRKFEALTRSSRRARAASHTDGARVEVEFPRVVDGHLLRKLAVHVVPRVEPASHGSDREDRRAVGRLQVRRRPERVLDRPHASRDVARSRRRSAAVPVRRPQERLARDGEGEEPRARRRRRKERIDRDVHAASRLLLHARSRHQPRIHLVPEGRRHAVRHGHPPGRGRRSAAVRRELRAAQRASRHDAAHGGVLPHLARSGRSHATGGDGVHARRRLQAGARLQDDGEPLPSSVHRAAARLRIARQHVRRSDGDALDGNQHRRV